MPNRITILSILLLLIWQAQGQDRALFFAVNQYDAMRPLSNPIQDARSIAQELEANYGFKAEVVENPSLEVIERKLNDYSDKYAANKYPQDAQLLIFFTGHGLVEFKNGFFMAKDSDPGRVTRTALGYEYWRPYINAIKCKHILVAVDACFSGTFDPNWYSKTDKIFKRPGELSEGNRLIAEHEKYKTRLFVTSATEVETPDKSAFAKKFLEGLRSKGGKDGILTFTELYSYIEYASPKPHNGDFGDDEAGSSFLFLSNNWRNAQTFDANTAQQREADWNAWKIAERAHTVSSYRTYVNQYPNGLFATQAKERMYQIADENEWQIAKTMDTESAYRQYLLQYPEGAHVVEARKNLQNLGKEELVVNDRPSISGSTKSTFSDRDGNTYAFKTMKDGKRWMTQNLNINIDGSYCYENQEDNCRQYGRLYTYEAAKEGCRLLGDGWRLPTDEEWREMAKKYGGADDDASDGGKAAYEALFKDGSSGFAALLGGWRGSNGSCNFLGTLGYYWTSTESSSGQAWSYLFNDGELWRFHGSYQTYGHSVRCLQPAR